MSILALLNLYLFLLTNRYTSPAAIAMAATIHNTPMGKSQGLSIFTAKPTSFSTAVTTLVNSLIGLTFLIT